VSDSAAAKDQIDANLAALPAEQREVLQALRETILAAAPEAEEAISYGMPAIRHRGKPVVAYAGFKTHCSLFPMSAELIERYGEDVASFATSKGTLQFTPQAPIPAELVGRIVRDRVAQIDAKTRKR
jgi:uncharacterized protein YdhG (YjbR/CyaY superfamily)